MMSIARLNEPVFSWVWIWAYGQLMVLFYMLHCELQKWCTDLDPVRTDRIVALVKFRQSQYDPEY
jgi:hypothetical protein